MKKIVLLFLLFLIPSTVHAMRHPPSKILENTRSLQLIGEFGECVGSLETWFFESKEYGRQYIVIKSKGIVHAIIYPRGIPEPYGMNGMYYHIWTNEGWIFVQLHESMYFDELVYTVLVEVDPEAVCWF